MYIIQIFCFICIYYPVNLLSIISTSFFFFFKNICEIFCVCKDYEWTMVNCDVFYADVRLWWAMAAERYLPAPHTQLIYDACSC